MSGVLRVVDLFAGAGGTTTGVLLATEDLGLKAEAVAVNHWPTAVATHSENHRQVRHYCSDIQTVDPLDVVPDGELDLLWASPECTHFSKARGGKPVNEQRRSGADWILEWLRKIRVRCLILENVEEWLSWGDVDAKGRPVSKTKGKLFLKWWKQLELLGYRAEYRVLNAADFGDATTRKRLFVQARNDGQPIVWPTPTHSKSGESDLFGTRPKWRAAREIIDWSDLGKSILDRPKPLSVKTRLRIGRGAQKFWGTLAPFYIRLLDLPDADEQRFVKGCSGAIAEAFMTSQFNSRGGIGCRPVGQPLTMVTTVARIGLVTPKGPDEPIGTATTATGGGIYVVNPEAEPFVLGRHGAPHARSADDPTPTSTSSGGGYLVTPAAEPFVLGQQSDSAARPTDRPIMAITTGGVIRLFSPTAEPFLDVYYQTGVADSVDEPLSTATTKARHAVVSPTVVPYGPRAEARGADQPVHAVMTKDRLGLASPTADPFLVPHFGEAEGQSPRVHDVEAPLPTVTNQGAGSVVVPIARVITPGFAEREGQAPRVHSVGEPVPSIAAQGHLQLATATVQVPAELANVDPRRLAFIDGVLHVLDILFRMLKPDELAAAMGFPPGYRFTGTKTDVVKQIGNAVACGTARALTLAMFGESRRDRLVS